MVGWTLYMSVCRHCPQHGMHDLALVLTRKSMSAAAGKTESEWGSTTVGAFGIGCGTALGRVKTGSVHGRLTTLHTHRGTM